MEAYLWNVPVNEALKDALKELRSQNFIRGDIADQIYKNGVYATYAELAGAPSPHYHIELKGKLSLYQFRRHNWFLNVRDGQLAVYGSNKRALPFGSGESSECSSTIGPPLATADIPGVLQLAIISDKLCPAVRRTT